MATKPLSQQLIQLAKSGKIDPAISQKIIENYGSDEGLDTPLEEAAPVSADRAPAMAKAKPKAIEGPKVLYGPPSPPAAPAKAAVPSNDDPVYSLEQVTAVGRAPSSPAPAKQGLGAGLLSGMDSAYNLQQQGVLAQAKAESDKSLETAKAIESNMAQIDKVNAQTQANEAKRNQDFQQKLVDYQTALDDFSSKEVDPDRYYKSLSTGKKVLYGISAFLGGVGGADASENPALQMLRQAIDNDINAQKSDIETKRAVVGAKQNIMSFMRDKFQDERMAEAAARTAIMDKLSQQTQMVAAKYNSPIVKARAAELVGKIREQKIEQRFKFEVAAQELLNKQRLGGMTQEDYNKRLVPGVGIALTPDDAKKAKEAKGAYEGAVSKLKELIKLRSDKGAEVLDRASVARGKSLAAELITDINTVKSLGALDKGTIEILDKVIPSDPLESNLSTWTLGIASDATSAQMKQALKQLSTTYKSNMRSLGLEPEELKTLEEN